LYKRRLGAPAPCGANRSPLPEHAPEDRIVKLKSFASTLTLLACAAATALAADPLPTKKVLPLDVAKKIAAAAEKHATENKWNVCIAIVDDGGHLIYFQRIDGTQAASVAISQAKAETAAKFKRPTKALEDAVMTGGRTVILALPGAVPVEGGLPITVDGTVIGAIGVSGVTSTQDGLVAQAGIDALPGILGTK
jgi:glc operon protein GlcG